LIEQNTIARFFTHFSEGTLPSGARMRTPQASLRLVESLQAQMPAGSTPLAIGNANLLVPFQRLFNALGSRANTERGVFVAGGMNLVKTAVSASPSNAMDS
jgi:hypothetical protein